MNKTQDTKSKERKLIRNLSIGMGLSLSAVIVLLVFSYKPKTVIPNPKLPNPNAFDTFKIAYSQLLDSAKIVYVLADTHNSGKKEDREYTNSEKVAILKENLPALKTLREGLNQEYGNPPVRSVSNMEAYLSNFKSLGELLTLEAKLKEEKGDWKGAMDSSLDCIQMGIKIPHGNGIIGGLAGISIQKDGRRSCDKCVKHLTAFEAKSVIKRLDETMRTQFKWESTMQEEAWQMRSILLNDKKDLSIFQYPVADNYDRRSKEWIARVKLPYSGHSILADTGIDFFGFNKMITDGYDRFFCTSVLGRTKNAILMFELALQAHKMEKGRYPTTLQELSPTYLKDLPIDPFAFTGTFRYRLDGAKYCLYSVGPDGKDDGGKAIDNPKAPGITTDLRARYRVKMESKGDIVSGVN